MKRNGTGQRARPTGLGVSGDPCGQAGTCTPRSTRPSTRLRRSSTWPGGCARRPARWRRCARWCCTPATVTHHVIGSGANDPQKYDPAASRETLDHSVPYVFAVALWRKVTTVEDLEWTHRYHDPDPDRRVFGGRAVITLDDGTVRSRTNSASPTPTRPTRSAAPRSARCSAAVGKRSWRLFRVRLFWRRRCRREEVVFQSGQPEQHEKRHRRAEQGYHDHDASLGSRRSRLRLDGKLAMFTVRPNGGGRKEGRVRIGRTGEVGTYGGTAWRRTAAACALLGCGRPRAGTSRLRPVRRPSQPKGAPPQGRPGRSAGVCQRVLYPVCCSFTTSRHSVRG